MFKEVKLSEIKSDGFLHSYINEFIYNDNKKTLVLKIDGADLKTGGIFYSCTITITDWWDLEVIESGKNTYKKYSIDETPTDIDQIIKYEYDGNLLVFESCGSLDLDSIIYYKFTKPKIHITGEYEPD